MKWLPIAMHLALISSGCHSEDIDPLEEQPKFKPYSESRFFADHSSMRDPPEGTVPRERVLDESPPKLTPALLALGREKFDVLCAPCHGLAGDGDSVVGSKMGLRRPRSLHDQQVRELPAARLFEIISHGYGLMPRFSDRLEVGERWAVVAYVRALELSQHVPVDQLPEDLRNRLEETR